jgi:hypothetical protein
MDTENPFKSPEPPREDAPRTARPLRPPILLTGTLLVIGVAFLLLLNGQVFTNTIVFLAFCAASVLLWIRLLFPADRNHHRRLAVVVVLGHLLIMLAFVPGLPGKYESQKKFNSRMERLHDRSGTAPGTP